MKILQQAVKAKRNQIVQIHFDQPVVVRLISKTMFPKYKDGGSFVSQGGHFEESPARFTVPYDGMWHAVIEKGSHYNPIDVSGRVELLPAEVKESYFVSDEEESQQYIEESTEEESEEEIVAQEEVSIDDEEDSRDDDATDNLENEEENTKGS